ncbi:hypothetical protein, partial [Thiolapillus sp.]|uniref:hypothetical protein n=1 Tax=Thiolapillus sp. TaxID=2017437 RepID=UPI003AF52DAF
KKFSFCYYLDRSFVQQDRQFCKLFTLITEMHADCFAGGTQKVTGLGRKTRKEIVKWYQMTALRFQTGRRHQTPPASLWGPGNRN